MAEPRKQTNPEGPPSEKPDDACLTNEEAQEEAQAEEHFITGTRLALIMVALISAMFLVALVGCLPITCVYEHGYSRSFR